MNSKKKLILLNIILFACLFFSNHAEVAVNLENNNFALVTPYGVFENLEPVIINLIKSKAIQRLKHIHQYGPSHYVKPGFVYGAGIQNDYTRYEHSIGVFALLRSIRRPLIEQIAGLLHDISHTAFSHVADMLFIEPGNQAYQDIILENFLKEHEIAEILKHYGINITDVLPEQYPSVKQPAPQTCADRLEYILYGGLLANFLTQNDFYFILKFLRFHEDKQFWYFTNVNAALKFAYVSLKLIQEYTGSEWNYFIYKTFAEIFRRSMKIGLIKLDDILYNLGDDQIWNKLTNSDDKELKKLIRKIFNSQNYISRINIQNNKNVDRLIAKFRGVNPIVKLKNNCYKTLTEIKTSEFRQQYNNTETLCKCGWPIQLLGLPPTKNPRILVGC